MKLVSAVVFSHCMVQGVVAFTVVGPTKFSSRPNIPETREEYQLYRAMHFEEPSNLPLTSTEIDMDRVKICAESGSEGGLCSLEEMSTFLDDLQRLQGECEQPRKIWNPECNVELQEERNSLMNDLENQMELCAEQMSQVEQPWRPKYSSQEHLQKLHEIAKLEEY